jgi:hypothetical protein
MTQLFSDLFSALTACISPEPISATSGAPRTYDAHVRAQAAEVLDILFAAEKAGAELAAQLDGVVGAASWAEYLAVKVYEGLRGAVEAIQDGAPIAAGALADALKRAGEEAPGFAWEHRELIVALLVIGVLVLLVPWALSALGFCEAGISEGQYDAF